MGWKDLAYNQAYIFSSTLTTAVKFLLGDPLGTLCLVMVERSFCDVRCSSVDAFWPLIDTITSPPDAVST